MQLRAPPLPESTARFHRLVVFEQVAPFGLGHQTEDCESTDQRSAGTKIPLLSAWQQHVSVPCLVALHADVLRESGRWPRWIHNGSIVHGEQTATLLCDVQFTRAVT